MLKAFTDVVGEHHRLLQEAIEVRSPQDAQQAVSSKYRCHAVGSARQERLASHA